MNRTAREALQLHLSSLKVKLDGHLKDSARHSAELEEINANIRAIREQVGDIESTLAGAA